LLNASATSPAIAPVRFKLGDDCSVKTPQDLLQVSLKAGDDAKRVLVAKSSSLAPDEFGIADHLAMIRAAQVAMDALAGV